MQHTVTQYRAFIGSLRKPAKITYAREYLAFIRGSRAEEPEYPGLSYMGAQAIRLTLNGIKDGTHSYPS